MTLRDRNKQDDRLRTIRKKLRLFPTKAEYVLWQELRKNKLGYKFRRQVSIDSFVVDFYCHELKCIIELDGPIHDEQKIYDKRREDFLKGKGYKVVRFKNDQVLFDRDKVMEKIFEFCLLNRGETSP